MIALGRLAWLGEVSAFGAITGRRVIGSGAEGLSRVAAQRHDRQLAAAADSLRNWGTTPFGFVRFIGPLPPDSLLLVAGDMTLPRGVRTSALENASWGAIYQPAWRLVTGPSNALTAGARGLTHDADPVVALAAAMTERTLTRLNDMGIRNRYRVASGRSVR